jgi:hypothetical protein
VAPNTAVAEHQDTAPKKMIGLPVMVVTPVDLGRLIRELENLDEQLLQGELRGSEERPKTSRLLDQTLELNKIDVLEEKERKLLITFLESIKVKAPILHMSFSADPSPNFLEKLMSWMRKEIHPLVLITVGLQPNLGAGCIIRSTNKYFDLSLRQDFAKKQDLLLAAIKEKMNVSETPQPEAQA